MEQGGGEGGGEDRGVEVQAIDTRRGKGPWALQDLRGRSGEKCKMLIFDIYFCIIILLKKCRKYLFFFKLIINVLLLFSIF